MELADQINRKSNKVSAEYKELVCLAKKFGRIGHFFSLFAGLSFLVVMFSLCSIIPTPDGQLLSSKTGWSMAVVAFVLTPIFSKIADCYDDRARLCKIDAIELRRNAILTQNLNDRIWLLDLPIF